MSMMIVAEPLFDRNMAVEAYRLRSHDGSKMLGIKDNYRKMDEAFSHPGLDIVEKIGLEAFTGNKLLFADLSPMQILTGLPANLRIDVDSLVCTVNAADAAKVDICRRLCDLGDQGYAIALVGYPEELSAQLRPYIRYVLLDSTLPNFFIDHGKVMRQLRSARTVICNVPSMEKFESLRRDTRAYFSGAFYGRPLTKNNAPLSPVKVNALHLLSQVSQEDFDLAEIVKTIERDPYLTVSLLKFINSNASGLSHQVDSIRQGVAILGQTAARQWAMVALSVTLGDDRPNEITRLALLRAKFAEGLAPAFELGVFQPTLFMAGLFSLLDVMLEKPMEEALNEVAVDARVREVLVKREGPYAPLMELIYAYERAEWDAVSILMIQNNTDMAHVSRAYLDALHWYRALLQSIDEAPENAETPPEAAQ